MTDGKIKFFREAEFLRSKENCIYILQNNFKIIFVNVKLTNKKTFNYLIIYGTLSLNDSETLVKFLCARDKAKSLCL